MRGPTVISLGLLSFLLVGCPRGGAGGPAYSGTIEAVEVDVAPEVAGRIVSRPVDQGDTVKKDDTVAVIDPESYRIALAETEASLVEARAKLAEMTAGYRKEEVETASHQVQEAEAQLTQAEARVNRVEEMLAQKIATPDDRDVAHRDRDVARARVDAAKSRLALLAHGYRREEIDQALAAVSRLQAARDQRRLDLARTTVKSPVAGTVTEKLQEPGEYARPGSPIVSVADLENLYTWVYLGEADLPRVRIGDDVVVRVDGMPGHDFPGKVVYVSRTAEFTPKNVQTAQDRVQLVFGVKVAVANPDGALKVGIPADVHLKPGASQ
ncbi:MAG TPA: efflux RND transporter periplasmic adaptor subunit [Nitrospirales bacterium]|jgi:HlyD family secretion protein|nr:efflux RND transporter periplasmic adaptor subunit [Nitrospirales bacterium]